jgi:riboflavin kinase/FMN adenylyltransferase
MEQLGRRFGFETQVLPNMWHRRMMVSSSQIRRLLEEGRVVQANRLLGRPFSVRGPIERGLGIGSKETVPTLNLGPYSGLLPGAGVYVTWTRLGDDVAGSPSEIAGTSSIGAGKGSQQPARLMRSVTNVGRRPTFGERELGVETHLLEPMPESPQGSSHGSAPSEMEVSFLYRLRDERKFDSPQELKAQIMKDVGRAEGYFQRVEKIGARE